jgi:hypothetical protein
VTRAARALATATLSDRESADREIGIALDEAAENGLVLLYAARIAALEGNSARALDLARQALAAEKPPLSPHHRDNATRPSGGNPERQTAPAESTDQRARRGYHGNRYGTACHKGSCTPVSPGLLRQFTHYSDLSGGFTGC